MSSIKQKLHSKTGASMILALMFMMICLIIGGTVLASATANGRRVADMQSDEQEYLSQRSAMLLMADMLKTSSDDELSLIIEDKTVTNLSDNTSTRTVTFTLPNTGSVKKPMLQKVLYESVLSAYFSKYREQYPAAPIPNSIYYINFEFADEIPREVLE